MNPLRIALLGVFLAGCGWGTADIEKIAEHPFRYQSRMVTVRGQVVWAGSLPEVGRNGIELAQGEARLLVLTTRPSPEIGSTVKLNGHVEAEFDLGNRRAPVLIEEESDQKRGGGATDVR